MRPHARHDVVSRCSDGSAPPLVPTTAPSLLILGTDTVLAAAPSTAVQLTHGCLAAGYEAVVPASWGDELVAARVLDRLRHTRGSVVQCSCPRVRERLSAHGGAIAQMIICTVPPAVAAAEYLRTLYAPTRPTITFAGSCPGGESPAIDTWLSPAELFASLVERGISIGDQATEFDALPADRRRFHSEPGGLPCRASLRQVDASVQCVEVESDDFVTIVGQHLLSSERALLDVSTVLGCACAGAVDGVRPAGARARVREHEPPRAPSPIVDHRVPVAIDADLPLRHSISLATAAASRSADESPPAPIAPPAAAEPARRRSPMGMPRPVFGAAPRSRSEGRPLPRAYIARRRSSPRGMRTIEPPAQAQAGPKPAGATGWLLVGVGVVAGAALVVLARLIL